MNDELEEVILDATTFTIKNSAPNYFDIGYALFASEDSVSLNGYQFYINGMVYSNKEFTYQGSILQINDVLISTENITMNGWKTSAESTVEYAEKVEVPDYTNMILHQLEEEMAKREGVLSATEITSDHAYLCDSVTSEYCQTIDFDHSFVSKQAISLNADQVSIGGETQIVLCSLEGDIEINTTNLDVNGLIYAPNGTVYLNVCHADILGTIIAKKIVINCTEMVVMQNE